MAGVPVFPAGHNDVAAWGLTAGLADNTDLFIEELGPDGRTVRDGDRFVPCQVRTEIIRVKGLPEVVEEVVVTPRGPVIGPAVGGDTCSMSMQATWLAPRPKRGLLRVHMARSFDEFRRAFEEWPLMSLNMLYADTRGKIGWQFVGEVPRRRKGWGTVSLPGWAPTPDGTTSL
jgi:penicillin amidase